MNMFKPVAATTIEGYIASLPEKQRREVVYMHAFIRGVVPSLTPHFAYNMIGYGNFNYRNYKKEIIDWPVIGLAGQKNYISLYVCALDNGQYIAETYKERLGNVSVGKSCIRFKTRDDIDMATLTTVLTSAEKSPGLTPQSV